MSLRPYHRSSPIPEFDSVSVSESPYRLTTKSVLKYRMVKAYSAPSCS